MQCPECNRIFNVKAKNVLRPGSKVQCPSCKVSIEISHDGKTKSSIRDVNRSLKDFEKAIKRFGK